MAEGSPALPNFVLTSAKGCGGVPTAAVSRRVPEVFFAAGAPDVSTGHRVHLLSVAVQSSRQNDARCRAGVA